MKLFERSAYCKKLVSELPLEKRKEIDGTLSQLLHLEQGRDVAERAFSKYKREMNEWESNLVKFVEKYVRESNVLAGKEIVAKYIKECNYTWSVEDITNEYWKSMRGEYVSFTAQDCIDNCKEALDKIIAPLT